MKFMKHFKGGAGYKSFGTYGIVSDYRLDYRCSVTGRGKGFFL
jgi:hypothetical protein